MKYQPRNGQICKPEVNQVQDRKQVKYRTESESESEMDIIEITRNENDWMD